MPRGFLCGGRIASVRGIAGTISDDRRRVTFAGAPRDAAPADVELEWTVGSPECDALAVRRPASVHHRGRIDRRRPLGTGVSTARARRRGEGSVIVSPRLPRGARRTACCAFVVAGCLALIGNPAAASQGRSAIAPRPRTPPGGRDARASLLHASHRRRLQPGSRKTARSRRALGRRSGSSEVSARDERIGLTVAKPGGRAHTVTLAARADRRQSAGRSRRRLRPLSPAAAADAESSSVLLDARPESWRSAIPDTALVPCRSREEGFGTRAVALLSAAVAVLVVVAALLFGLRKLRYVGAA